MSELEKAGSIRQDGWEERLFATVERFRHLSFSRDGGDCVSLVRECTRALGDGEPTALDRACPSYNDDASAEAALKALGKGGIVKALSKMLDEVAPAMAQRGDIVWLGETGDTLPGVGVCVGELAVTMSPEDGLAFVSMDDAKKAWRVN